MREIDVKQGGVYKRIDQAWIKRGDGYLRVVGIFVKYKGVLEAIWDYTPSKPPNLHKVAQDYSSISLQWGASSQADKYQILQRATYLDKNGVAQAKQSSTPTVVKNLDPGDGAYFANRTWKVTGLAMNHHYVYTVRAINSALHVDVLSPESEPVKVYTGQTEKVANGSSKHKVGNTDFDYYEFQPTKIDTYSKAKDWGTRAGRPAQGTYDGSGVDGRNQYGCIDYSGVYNRMVNLHEYITIEDANGKETSKPIANYIHVTKAELQAISRPDDFPGDTAPTLRLHSGQFVIGSAGVPRITTGDDTRDTPTIRKGKTIGPINIPIAWANDWANPQGSRDHNGLVVYWPTGTERCVLASASEPGMPNSWDLRLEYEWHITTRPHKNYTTNDDYKWPPEVV